MTSKDSGKIALDEYEQFKMMNDFLSSIKVVNWVATGIPPIFQDELMRLKEVVEAKGGALPLILQEMLKPEDLGQMNIGVDLVKGKQQSNQKTMLPDWGNSDLDSRDDYTVGDKVIPSYGWIKYCYPKLWKLILELRIQLATGKPIRRIDMNKPIKYWIGNKNTTTFDDLHIFINNEFIKYACANYCWSIEIIRDMVVRSLPKCPNTNIKYHKAINPTNGKEIDFKGASTMNRADDWNRIGTLYQLKRKDKDYTRWYGRFTDLPGVGKDKVGRWVALGMEGFIDLMAIMDGDVTNYKNLMILPGVGSEEACKKMIISEQFGKWFGNEYKKPEYYMEEV